MTSRRVGAIAGLVIGLAWCGGSHAAEPLSYGFTPESTVTYHVQHPFHHVVGISHQLEGDPKVTPGSNPELVLPLTLSVPIRSFDSGNRNRDRNMLQVMHAGRFPEAVLEIRSVKWTRKTTAGARTTAEGMASGELTLNGTTRPVAIRLGGFVEGSGLQVEADFSFLLSEFAVERPSLLFRPVDDQVRLEVKGLAQRR